MFNKNEGVKMKSLASASIIATIAMFLIGGFLKISVK